MMNEAIQIIDSITILMVVKVLIVTLVSVYTVFAYLMMRMAGSMTRAVQMKDGVIINTLSLAHFIFAIVVLMLSIVVL